MIRSDLLSCGFLPNDTKCVWSPVQFIEWLGVIIDSRNGTISPTARRIDKIFSSINDLNLASGCRVFQVKIIASLVGQIISLGSCFGNLVRIMTRNLYKCIESRFSWFSLITLDDLACNDIMFWNQFLKDFVCKSIWRTSKSEVVAYSDASDTGFGGYISECGDLKFHGEWSSFVLS